MDARDDGEFKKVCQQLDNIIIDFFQTLSELLTCREELDESLKDGYFYMARARYTMGSKSVTSMQYNADDLSRALTRVDVFSDADDSLFFKPDLASSSRTTLPPRVHARNAPVATTPCVRYRNGEESIELDCMSRPTVVDGNDDVGLGLRKRKLATKMEVGGPRDEIPSELGVPDDSSFADGLVADVDRMTCDDRDSGVGNGPTEYPDDVSERSVVVDGIVDSADVVVVQKDPLHWFGLLVPQSLRQSQASFRRAVELSCRAATLQGRLAFWKVQFLRKMKRKRELQEVGRRRSTAEAEQDLANDDDDSPLTTTRDSPVLATTESPVLAETPTFIQAVDSE